jgi:hypothetical protein
MVGRGVSDACFRRAKNAPGFQNIFVEMRWPGREQAHFTFPQEKVKWACWLARDYAVA